MFENGSLLRRRKRFKLHKPDKELLKNELQALASAMPPPHAEAGAGATPSEALSPSTPSSLSAANLHRLREDLLRWELQERRMMVAAASSTATAGFGRFDGGAEAASYYLLSPEARQRLTGADGGAEVSRSYEAALLQSGTWNFSNFGCTPPGYLPQLPYLQRQTSLPPGELETHNRLCERRASSSGGENNPASHHLDEHYDNAYDSRFRERSSDDDSARSSSRMDSVYRIATTAPNSPKSPESPISKYAQRSGDAVYGSSLSPVRSFPDQMTEQQQRTPRTSPSLDHSSTTSIAQSAKAKTKKPFTIENIIAPDNNEDMPQDNSEIKKSVALMIPRPLYAGYPLPVVGASIQRPPYGTTT